MALLGADTDELREVGQEFEQGKEVVDDVITFLRALIAILRAASFFSGGASLAYAEYLETTIVPWLQKISQALGLFAKVLTSQAQAQDETSDGAKVDLATLPTYSTPALPAPITPYQGQPIAGGPADGAVAAGGTGSQVQTTPATTTRTDTTIPGVTTTTTTTTTTTGPATSPAAGIAAATGAVGALGAGGAIGAGGSTGSATPVPRSAPGLAGTWSTTPGDASLGSTGGLGNRELPASALGSGHTGALGSTGGIGASGGGSGSDLGSAGGSGSSALGSHGSLHGGGTGGTGGTGDLGGPGSTGGGSVHANTPVDGALGGATPGAPTTGGELAAGHQPSGGSPVSTAAIGAAATGAAALGIGGAALAARAGSGGSGSIDSLATQVGRGSTGTGVTAMQEQLTAAGYDTKGADGAWGKDTEAAYQAYRADHPVEVRQGTGYTSPDGYDYSGITGIRNANPEFLRSVEAMSQRVGARPEHVLAAMSFETGGTFAADARNPHSSATGLIQFMDKTAQGMGTSTAALAAMTPTEQLTYVERYLQPFHGRLGDLDSVYSSILAGHPASGDDVLFREGTRAFTANAPLDSDGNGAITASEAAAHVRTRLGTGSN